MSFLSTNWVKTVKVWRYHTSITVPPASSACLALAVSRVSIPRAEREIPMETKRIKTDSRICWKTREKKCLLQLNNFDIINESSRTMFILLWKYWEALCHFRFLKINVSCYIFNLSPPITGRMLRHWVKIVLHWYNLFIAQSDDKLPLQNPTQSSTTNPLLTKINIKQDPTCSFCQKPFRKPYPPLLGPFENRSILGKRV